MLSVETYLSFLNYEGIGAHHVPAMGIVHLSEKPQPLPTTSSAQSFVERPEKKRAHWAQGYQLKFSRWLSGKGPQVDGLDYDLEALRSHLERQFIKGMRWNNYAGNLPYRTRKRTWVVDHIVPKRLFAEHDVQSAYALTNLRPLWIMDNIIKGNARVHLV